MIAFHRAAHCASCGMLSLILLAGLALATCAGAQQAKPLAFGKLMPADTVFAYTANTAGFGAGLARFQAFPPLKIAIAAAEEALGFTLAHDVIPWAGQCGVAVLDVKAGSPRVLLLLEIRDPHAFQQVQPRLQAKLERLSLLNWRAETYAGIPLRTAMLTPRTTCAWGQLGGWLVLGLGEGAICQGIDACQGTAPSLADNTAWAKAVAALPTQRESFFSLNGDALAKGIAALTDAIDTTSLRGMMLLGCMAQHGQTARFDISCTIGSAELRARLQALKGVLTPVDGKVLAQLPPGVFATLLISNPGKCADFLKQSLLACVAHPADKQWIEELCTQAQPLLQVLNNCPGACGAAACWTKEQGFGATLLGETPSAAQAKNRVLLFTDYLKTVPGLHIAQAEGIASLPEMRLDPMLRLQLCWAAQDAWFKCGAAPAWVHGAGTGAMKLPLEASGADGVLQADVSFLAPLLGQLEERLLMDPLETFNKSGHHIAQFGIMGITALRLLDLDQVHMFGYARLAGDGASCHVALEVNHAPGLAGLLTVAGMSALVVIPRLFTADERYRAATYHDNLNEIMKGVEVFHNDVGVYPAVLDDLYAFSVENLNHATTAQAGFTGVNFHGPYLTTNMGISATVQLPANPYVTGGTTTAAHWKYTLVAATAKTPAGYTLVGVLQPPAGY